MEEKIITLSKRYIDEETAVAIVLAKHWFFIFGTFYGADKAKEFVSPDDFVVCKWSELSDGERIYPEAKQTLAICKKLEYANLIYNSL